jgi:hypothetical protein
MWEEVLLAVSILTVVLVAMLACIVCVLRMYFPEKSFLSLVLIVVGYTILALTITGTILDSE